MKHKFIKILLFLICIALIVMSMLFYALYIGPEKISIKHKSFTSSKVVSTIDDINIAFISDIHYGEFVDETRLEAMVKKINSASPDIVLFGGDLFSDAEKYSDRNDELKKVTDLLRQIEAPLGKFYVFGECDLKSAESKQIVSTILYDANFENLTNKNIKIHNGASDGFHLVGIDSLISGTPDIEKAYKGTSNSTLTIAFSHAPDVFQNVPSNTTDLAFAGHSHGGQITLPLLGSLSPVDGATIYSKGVYKIKDFVLCVSNGLGTTGYDARLFAPAEIIVYRLTK